VTSKASIWLAKSLSYEFNDADLLQQALTHRSCPGKNNERLEFLGDAVLDFVISEVVYGSHPNAPEGDLSKLRASLVKDASLGKLAMGLGVGEHLILGGGERKSGGHRRESILADANPTRSCTSASPISEMPLSVMVLPPPRPRLEAATNPSPANSLRRNRTDRGPRSKP
jgi:hypothetical protein